MTYVFAAMASALRECKRSTTYEPEGLSTKSTYECDKIEAKLGVSTRIGSPWNVTKTHPKTVYEQTHEVGDEADPSGYIFCEDS